MVLAASADVEAVGGSDPDVAAAGGENAGDAAGGQAEAGADDLPAAIGKAGEAAAIAGAHRGPYDAVGPLGETIDDVAEKRIGERLEAAVAVAGDVAGDEADPHVAIGGGEKRGDVVGGQFVTAARQYRFEPDAIEAEQAGAGAKPEIAIARLGERPDIGRGAIFDRPGGMVELREAAAGIERGGGRRGDGEKGEQQVAEAPDHARRRERRGAWQVGAGQVGRGITEPR